MRGFIIGLSSFLLGGSAAAALSLVGHSHSISAAAHPLATSVAPARIAVAQASVSDAYAKGLIVRPISTVLNVPARMRYGEFRWEEKGVPAGPTWGRVDLQSQIISVFRGGHEIGTALILYGADRMPSPPVKLPILV